MIALISDVHGNYPALIAVLTEIDRLGISDIVCLGDTAGYYSQINECCDALRGRDVFSLKGNHDWYLTSDAGCPRSDSATRCIEHQASIVTSENAAWLGSLNSAAMINGINAVHGGWNDPVDEYVQPSDEYFRPLDGTTFASGHTHIQTIWSSDNRQYCNPGSVGQPRDGDARAAFATWDGQHFELHRVGYEIGETQFHMRQAGFSDYFWKNLEFGLRIGADPNDVSDHQENL